MSTELQLKAAEIAAQAQTIEELEVLDLLALLRTTVQILTWQEQQAAVQQQAALDLLALFVQQVLVQKCKY
jgi:hypothetical protein